MIREPRIPLFDLAVCLSDACDLVSPALVNHHKKTAFIASCIGEEMELDEERLSELVLAGTIHDIGALSLRERLETLSFETEQTTAHSLTGYHLLRSFKPLCRVAEIICNHHRRWSDNAVGDNAAAAKGIESDILHIADRIAVLIDKNTNILGQTDRILAAISSFSGTMFCPEAVSAFSNLAKKEYFWLDAVSSSVYRILRRKMRTRIIALDLPQLDELATVFSRIIDFRSKFTAAHSAGVAASAGALAQLAGFSERECAYMRIAGLLHDLGKLSVPCEILEKPDKLNEHEFEIIRAHTYHTFRILDTLENFETITMWAAFHHERISGDGYPFHHRGSDLSLGSRIMCVADIFTALTEDRPYRSGLKTSDACSLLRSMAARKSIDEKIAALLEANIESVNNIRLESRVESIRSYKDIAQYIT